jgi:perosamine synthetase
VKHGETVSAFERELASYCNAEYAIAASNGTVTLQAALVALGVKPGDRVAVPPLTHAATTIAVLNVGAVPLFCDVNPDTWLIGRDEPGEDADFLIPVSLYGLHADPTFASVDDAAQTLRPHNEHAHFTSLSFQASKILSTGEGGALLTNDEELAERARSYLSLGYRMSATQARIDTAAIKSPTFDRHVQSPAINGRMNDVTAELGLARIKPDPRRPGDAVQQLIARRQHCALWYEKMIAGCAWLAPQLVSPGMVHDYWCYAVACDTPERALWLQAKMAELGAEVPYGAWRLTYQEPAFANLLFESAGNWIQTQDGECYPHKVCPVAESLQPRLLQFATNNLQSAETNARALRKAIEEAGE